MTDIRSNDPPTAVLLPEIAERWRDCRSDAQREILWIHLTRPAGLWLRALRELAEHRPESPQTAISLWEDWFNGANPESPVRFCKQGFSFSYQVQWLRIGFGAALFAAGDERANGTDSALKQTADSESLPRGLIGDLVNTISGDRLQPGDRVVRLTALLVNDALKGVPASLILERLPSGSGALIPVPELGLCRDIAFMEAETMAARTALADHPGIDVRWNLQRLDGEPLGHLTGASMGGAFAVGLRCLLDPPGDFEPGYLNQTAVSAALDEEGRLRAVGALCQGLALEQYAELRIELAGARIQIRGSDEERLPVEDGRLGVQAGAR